MSTTTSETSPIVWTPWTPEQREAESAAHDEPGGHGILLIAEIANAHQGRVAEAMKLVEAAAEAGCDAVKFQKYYPSEMLAKGHSMTATFDGLVWDESGWRQLMESAKSADLMVFTDVFGIRAFESLKDLPPVDGLKLHGADVGNTPLLDALSETDYPILIGTGGCSDLDLHLAEQVLANPHVLLPLSSPGSCVFSAVRGPIPRPPPPASHPDAAPAHTRSLLPAAGPDTRARARGYTRCRHPACEP